MKRSSSGSSVKDIFVAFEKFSVSSSNQASNQIKNDGENLAPFQGQVFSAIHKVGKNHAQIVPSQESNCKKYQ